MARRMVGQKGLPGVRPDYDEVMAEFSDDDGPPAGTVRAAKMGLRELIRGWIIYEKQLAGAPMARILRELAREQSEGPEEA